MALVIRPWASKADLKELWNLFSSTGSGSSTSQRKACDIVNVWNHRCAGKMPHHILSTSALMNAKLDDKPGGSSVQTIAAAYAIAIASFVTWSTDIEQDKEYKVRMFDVAKSIGISAQLVEVRHTIAHGKTPSLLVLREAAEEALEWLRKEYWAHIFNQESSTETDGISDVGRRFRETFKYVDGLLQNYTKFAASVEAKEAINCETEAMAVVKNIQQFCKGDQERLRVAKNTLAQPEYCGPGIAWDYLGNQARGII